MTEGDPLGRMNALAKEILADPGYFKLPNLRPRDASALILIDRSGTTAKVLLGRRHHGHAFMPGKFVFPGGRLEPADRSMQTARPLDPRIEARLLRDVRRPSAAWARALALASIRETYEETGLLLGRPDGAFATAPQGPWAAFAAAQVLPDLGAIHFVARAITPPRRSRRFDTRFFAAAADAIAHRIDGMIGPDTELVELVWVPIAQAPALDMAAITAVMLHELKLRIAAGFTHDLPVPFYQMRHRRFVRELL
jgi:8-oxo-dGTP pyrophosphatase MutT (NUDIX family)